MVLDTVPIKPFQRREEGMVSATMKTETNRGESSSYSDSSNSSKAEEELDSSLWSKLPEDLLLCILARLSLESLARLEQVCRNWKALWRTRAFLLLRSGATASSSNSWFIFQRKQHPPFTAPMTVDCYNTHTNKWHELRFNHLPQIQQVCATAGSLLLCVGRIRVCRLPTTSAATTVEGNNNANIMPGRIEPPSYKFLDMIVCNPLKPSAWERIPERIGSSVPHLGMVADAHTGNYKVILASLEKTEIYDSRSKTWKLFDNVLSPLYDVCSSPVEYRGRLLFLGVGANGQGKVFVYDVDGNSCSSFDNLFSLDPLPRYGYLENCGGRLLMVRMTVSTTKLLRSRELQRTRTIRFERNCKLRVLEYLHAEDNLSDGIWRELTSIPMLELENSISVNSKEGADFIARASATSSKQSLSSLPRTDLLCFTMGVKDGKLDCTNNCVDGRAVFLYSLSQNLWCFVAESPEWARESTNFMRSPQFQPSLHASFVP